MHKKIAALTVLGLIALSAHGSPYDGAWTASVVPKQGEPFSADVVVDGEGGSWQARVRTNREVPCLGRKFPVHVLTASADEMSFRVAASESLPGCNDFTVKLQRVDDRTLTGTRGNAAITLKHE